MPSSQLLLMVQVSCSQQHLEQFNLWYNSHLPNLLRILGYLWAQRYLGVPSPGPDQESRFTALYGIRAAEDLTKLLEWNGPSLHPIAAAEFANWEKLQGLSMRIGNVYEQISGSPLRDPLLLSDRPLSIVTADVDPRHEEKWDRWYTESHVPNLLKVPGYALAGRFRVFEHPALSGFNTGPKYLALYECESEEVLSTLGPGEAMHPEAEVELQRWQERGLPHVSNFGWGFHKLISKHFRWPDA